MKKNPLVSVVTPFFNEEKYLDSCLFSIANQTYKNVQIIAVDDGSNDNSKRKVQSAKQQFKFKNLTILEQCHLGPGAARNLGATMAKGEILVFADADMHYDKNYIQKLIKPIVEGKTIGTFTKEEFIANPDNLWSYCWNINSNLPRERRLPTDYPDTENAFRAILKKEFVRVEGFDENEGYTDDSSLARKLKIKALSAKGAICYHFNPSTLFEVFYSARWIGRSKIFRPSFENFLRFSPLNSLRISFKYILQKAPLSIIPFKLVYDFGVFTGIFISSEKYYK
ncbi:MAG: glycosyltransferase family 2 protein [Candidatus Levyibacteriota bacterium]